MDIALREVGILVEINKMYNALTSSAIFAEFMENVAAADLTSGKTKKVFVAG
jgi:hypothetical protein